MYDIEINTAEKEFCSYDYSKLDKIDQVDYDKITYDSFFTKYMLKNIPCIIKNVSSTWECNRKWTEDGKIIYDYFSETYGDLEAPIADCDKINFNSHCKTDMKVSAYMTYLKSTNKDKLLYLKDWHLQRLRPSDAFYEIPLLFASDWLNEYAVDHRSDDFMFVYIGPRESWTPLHADVYNSYSWSVNVVGKKKWILLPPGEEEKLKDALGNLPLFTDVTRNVKYFEIIQEQGDAIFVPSGWFHQVLNLLDTISINHNWINACNIDHVWEALQCSLTSVEKEIEEFRDTPEYYSQCQLILKSLFGMDYVSFITFLIYISKKRLNQMEASNKLEFQKFEFGHNHKRFDIKVLSKIINDIDMSQDLFFNNFCPAHLKNDFMSTKLLLSSFNNFKDCANQGPA
ncbi:2-oxoglutarate and iron-dependent oxygenase JMJD4 homolog [Plodia interpunctella]|uniref:2-oxoglutarate and iron-dependent oxygenase JMJD4 homolog n=1 Tax=Plodia interpunctella TaxID=58824 RepID=UPI0023675346|nr:2-oxoglutarate and iron-dependent oxygenase JMJD4 homolog [Plodia interpunctella]